MSIVLIDDYLLSVDETIDNIMHICGISNYKDKLVIINHNDSKITNLSEYRLPSDVYNIRYFYIVDGICICASSNNISGECVCVVEWFEVNNTLFTVRLTKFVEFNTIRRVLNKVKEFKVLTDDLAN